MSTGKQKNHTELSEEELLKILQEESLDENSEQTNNSINTYTNNDNCDDIVSFLLRFNIKPGNELVSLTLIYKLYCLWYKGENKLTKLNLKKIITDYLPGDFSGKIVFFKCNRDFLDIEKFLTENRSKKRNLLMSKSYRAQIETFLNKHDIKPGDTYIDPEILYQLFLNWTTSKRPHTLSTFKELLKIYLKTKLIDGYLLFEIDNSNIGKYLNEEIYQQIRQRKASNEEENIEKV